MIAPLRRLHRHIWLAWVVIVAAAATLILMLQP